MSGEEATFTINFEANDAGIKRASSSLEELRAYVKQGTAALQELKATAERMKGISDVARFEAIPKELQKAKDEAAKLQAQLGKTFEKYATAKPDKKAGVFAQGEQINAALSAAQGSVAKLSGEYDKLKETSAVKQFVAVNNALKDTEGALGKATSKLASMGGTMNEIGPKATTAFGSFYEGAEKTGAKLKALVGTQGEIAAVLAMVKGLAVALAVVSGLAMAATGFAAWAADGARSMGLLREAAGGGTKGAEEIADAMSSVRSRTNATREELQGLAIDLRRANLSGDTLRHGLSALTIEAKTMGESASGQLRALIDKGKLTKRFIVNPFDLVGTGLAMKDLAQQLSNQTGVAIGAAEAALRNGQVKLSDGIKALDGAVQAKFGDIARRQMLALPVQLDRFKENIKGLFSGVNLDKFLEGLAKVLDMFDETTDTGYQLREAVSTVFQGLFDSATSVLPSVQDMIGDVVLAALDMAIAFEQSGGFSHFFADAKSSAQELWDVLKGIASVVGVISKGYDIIRHPLATANKDANDSKNGYRELTGKEATEMGMNLTAGIAQGIDAGSGKPVGAIVSLADKMKAAFNKANEIQSPSKWYRRQAAFIPEGEALGVEDGTPKVDRAIGKMSAPRASQGTRGDGRSGPAIVVNIENYNGGTQSKGDKEEARAFFTEVLEDVARSLGLPIPGLTS